LSFIAKSENGPKENPACPGTPDPAARSRRVSDWADNRGAAVSRRFRTTTEIARLRSTRLWSAAGTFSGRGKGSESIWTMKNDSGISVARLAPSTSTEVKLEALETKQMRRSLEA
jgi:hypothetical protein